MIPTLLSSSQAFLEKTGRPVLWPIAPTLYVDFSQLRVDGSLTSIAHHNQLNALTREEFLDASVANVRGYKFEIVPDEEI